MSDYSDDFDFLQPRTKSDAVYWIKEYLENNYKAYNMKVTSFTAKKGMPEGDGRIYFNYTGKVRYVENGIAYTMETYGDAVYDPKGKSSYVGFRGYFHNTKKARVKTNSAGIPTKAWKF